MSAHDLHGDPALVSMSASASAAFSDPALMDEAIVTSLPESSSKTETNL